VASRQITLLPFKIKGGDIMNIGNGIRVIRYTENRVKVFFRGSVMGYTTESNLNAFINSLM
jgi:hypothetical protein